MDAKKISTMIVAIVLTVVLGFSTFWVIKNRKALGAFFSGTEVTTATELQDERDWNKNTIDDLLKKVADRDKQITGLLANIAANEKQLLELLANYIASGSTDITSMIAELAALLEQYTGTISGLNSTISSLNNDIANYLNQISTLTFSNGNKDITISQLNGQIGILQASVSSLSSQVSTLTRTVNTLSSDNSLMMLQLTQLQSATHGYNVQIQRLTSLVTYLSSIVIDWENRTEFLVTFYVNGMIWDIQIIDSANPDVTIPTSPQGNFTFLGWSFDKHTVIDPTNYPILTDIEIHAVINVTATFLANGEVYNTQTFLQNGTATVPTAPTSESHDFLGWSINGSSVVDVSAVQLANNTIFAALWSIRTYSVSFEVFGETYGSTQTVEHGLYVIIPNNPQVNNFSGWSIDGNTVINIGTYPITKTTTFIAVIQSFEIVYADNTVWSQYSGAVGRYMYGTSWRNYGPAENFNIASVEHRVFVSDFDLQPILHNPFKLIKFTTDYHVTGGYLFRIEFTINADGSLHSYSTSNANITISTTRLEHSHSEHGNSCSVYYTVCGLDNFFDHIEFMMSGFMSKIEVIY